MGLSALSALISRFAEPADRVDAAADLARHLGVERVLGFGRDPELGVLLPAAGFPQTVAGGPAWRALLKTSASQPGVHRAELAMSLDGAHVVAVTVCASVNGAALFLIGGHPDLAALEELDVMLPLLGALFRGEQSVQLARGEAEVARLDGLHASSLATALDSARGDVERALTESARLNAELKETDRRKDDFMAMLGHELRNPLAAVSGAIEIMRANEGNWSQMQRARSVIERQTEQLARLVDDLLDVARVTRGKITLRRERLDVASVVRHAMEATATFATKQQDFQLVVRAPAWVDADRTRLHQMVSNLLTNASKYTDQDGHIVVTVDHDGADVVIRVEDDGIGISPAMLPHVFDAFLQVDPTLDRGAGGLGVGLTVVSYLTSLHGGRVDAESELGKGSVFSIRLPRVEAPDAADADAAVKPAGAPHRKRVLVVDDNVDSAEMMVLLAETWGHEAFHAGDGHLAVEMARELIPDVVLLDIGLPGLDGYEVAAALRKDPLTRTARIIAVSGYGQDSDRQKSRAAGCDEHMAKPVNLVDLQRALSST